MQLAINGRFLLRRLTGVDRFASEVIAAMQRIRSETKPDDRFHLTVVTPSQPPDVGERAFEFRQVGSGSGQLWEQLSFPRALRRGEIGLSLCNTAPILGRNQVVVIHDAATVAIPHAFSRGFRWWYRLLMPMLGRVSKRVLTVSEFSKDELTKRFGIPKEKITVVVEGGEHILRLPPDRGALSKFGLGERPYVFAVSSMAAHKNFRLVLKALSTLADPPFDVAIAGGANARVFGTEGIVETDRIKWLGYVSDSELRALYEGAMCFVFPSLYEGFGIPPLEAMHCGCPVVASRAASIPEVCGDAALYFDPCDSDELAALLVRVSGDDSLRADLRARGYEQAKKFSWEKAARQVLDACREVAA